MSRNRNHNSWAIVIDTIAMLSHYHRIMQDMLKIMLYPFWIFCALSYSAINTWMRMWIWKGSWGRLGAAGASGTIRPCCCSHPLPTPSRRCPLCWSCSTWGGWGRRWSRSRQLQSRLCRRRRRSWLCRSWSCGYAELLIDYNESYEHFGVQGLISPWPWLYRLTMVVTD